MTTPVLLDAAGRRRSPAAMPGHHCGRPPRNKGLRYPADPPTVEEIVAVMRFAGDTPYGVRARTLIVILWRSGLRISEALSLAESDLDRAAGGVLVRRGKGGKRREVGMDRWGWQQVAPWLDLRTALPVGALLCVIDGRTAGRPWSLRQPLARRCAISPSARACGGASRRISFAMRTRSRWHARASP
jgi:site-specific recombinase XerC